VFLNEALKNYIKHASTTTAERCRHKMNTLSADVSDRNRTNNNSLSSNYAKVGRVTTYYASRQNCSRHELVKIAKRSANKARIIQFVENIVN